MYRWAPGKWTRIQTEPAPSVLFKATGIGPHHEKGRTRHPFRYGAGGRSTRGFASFFMKRGAYSADVIVPALAMRPRPPECHRARQLIGMQR